MIYAAPGGWTVETVRLSAVPEPSRHHDAAAGTGPYLIVRRNGRTIATVPDSGPLRGWPDVAAAGCPIDQLAEDDGPAVPARRADAWLDARRARRSGRMTTCPA
jgi:hypothetical protein